MVLVVHCTSREDSDINEIGCIWVEITFHQNAKLLNGLLYRPPYSSTVSGGLTELSVDIAFDTNTSNSIITGKFMQSYICSQTSHSCRQYGLTECIKQAMNFPEHLLSIIDLILYPLKILKLNIT